MGDAATRRSSLRLLFADVLRSAATAFQNLADFYQAFLEAVDAQAWVSHRGADAVFAKTCGFDAQLSQQGQDGRGLSAVAFEFDDDDVVHRGILASFVVVEVEVEVDGQALGLFKVHQRDAQKLVAEGRREVVEGDAQHIVEELLAFVVADDGIDGRNGYALLLRLAVVVLALDFEERMSRVQIGARSHLRARQVARLVEVEHIMPLGVVPIRGAVGADALAVDRLRIITALAEVEQPHEHVHGSDELRVHAVH